MQILLLLVIRSNTVAGLNSSLDNTLREDDVYLAYLPLAHILEFVCEHFMMFKGIRLGFGSPRSLSDASVRNCNGDLRELRPTIMAAVPTIWETLRKGILAKVQKSSPFQQKVFSAAIELKQLFPLFKPLHALLDEKVFKAVKDVAGGRLRYALSGGAPISAETQLFMSACMCPLAQGYGMTETCGVIAVQDIIEAGKPGSVGAPGSCAEVRLVASGSYNPNPERGNAQQGEIWVRGGNIMKGYYKAPELTKETITSDGWLQTGDIGEWTDAGCVKIIDRKKNLVKLSHGEYIALEKLESEYKTCTLVGNMMIHADPLESYIVALIQPNMAELKRIALELGVDSNVETDPKVHRAVLLKLAETATRAGLAGAEVLKTFTIVAEEWTSENGLLTAAQKLQRKNVLQAYEKEISRMYNRK
jgi:long-chain acyl-CoA synthetase